MTVITCLNEFFGCLKNRSALAVHFFYVKTLLLCLCSMGYCVLVVHGLNRLYSVVSRWGAAALTVSMLVVLLLFSWKTVQQNEIWLSREVLFRCVSLPGLSVLKRKLTQDFCTVCICKICFERFLCIPLDEKQ